MHLLFSINDRKNEAVNTEGEKSVKTRLVLGFAPILATLGSPYVSWCLEAPYPYPLG
jgi:hypothetical protein